MLGVILALAVSLLRLGALRLKARGELPAATPYTAMLREVGSGILYTAVLVDGARILGWDRHAPGVPMISKRLIELPNGLKTDVDDFAKLRSTIKDASSVVPFRYHLDPGSSCMEPLALGVKLPPHVLRTKGNFLNYRAARIKDERNGRVQWFALDYGCAMIDSEIALGGGIVSKKNLVSLAGGEPSELLFDVS